ncbi:MAG: hypothetical protein KDD40_05575, partial [Bdellovibrionales bacterium]|nr:hypothetical protein [Bdellovibrionales bacterium]
MPKTLIFFIVIQALSIAAKAVEPETLQIINRMNQVEYPCDTCDQQSTEQKQTRAHYVSQCITELCKDWSGETLKELENKIENKLQEKDPYFENTIRPSIVKYITDKVQKVKREVIEALAFARKHRTENIEMASSSQIEKFTLASNLKNSYETHVVLQQSEEVKAGEMQMTDVAKTTTRLQAIGASAAQIQWYLRVNEIERQSMAKIYSYDEIVLGVFGGKGFSTAEYYYKRRYPDKSFKEIVQIEIKKIERYSRNPHLLMTTPNGTKVSVLSELPRQQLQNLKSKESFSEEELSQLKVLSTSYELFSEILNQPEYRSLIFNPPIETYGQVLASDSLETRAQKFLQELRDDANLEQVIDEIIDDCHSNYSRGLAALPSVNDEHYKAAQEYKQSAKNLLMQNIFSHFSQKTRKALQSPMNNRFFVLPQTVEAYKNQWRENVKKINSDSEQNNNIVNVYDLRESVDRYLPSDREFDKETFVESVSEIGEICGDPVGSLIPDATYAADGGIVTGVSSTRNLHFGQAAMLHELGHNFSHLFTNNNISKTSANQFSQL